mmetsp:Transcript_16471/g.51133  ORF Transcript_16471/g.51133 Transcript_16471/m.51133 type:complete len:416 (-) Transcript_16471:196-1443(-)
MDDSGRERLRPLRPRRRAPFRRLLLARAATATPHRVRPRPAAPQPRVARDRAEGGAADGAAGRLHALLDGAAVPRTADRRRAQPVHRRVVHGRRDAICKATPLRHGRPRGPQPPREDHAGRARGAALALPRIHAERAGGALRHRPRAPVAGAVQRRDRGHRSERPRDVHPLEADARHRRAQRHGVHRVAPRPARADGDNHVGAADSRALIDAFDPPGADNSLRCRAAAAHRRQRLREQHHRPRPRWRLPHTRGLRALPRRRAVRWHRHLEVPAHARVRVHEQPADHRRRERGASPCTVRESLSEPGGPPRHRRGQPEAEPLRGARPVVEPPSALGVLRRVDPAPAEHRVDVVDAHAVVPVHCAAGVRRGSRRQGQKGRRRRPTNPRRAPQAGGGGPEGSGAGAAAARAAVVHRVA